MKKWLVSSLLLLFILLGCHRRDYQRDVSPYQIAILDGKDIVTLTIDNAPKVIECLEATDYELTINQHFPIVPSKGAHYAVANVGKGQLLPISLSPQLFLEPISLGNHSLNNSYAVSENGFLFSNSQRGGTVTFYLYSHKGNEKKTVDFKEPYDYVDSLSLLSADGQYYALMHLTNFDDRVHFRGHYQIWVLSDTLERQAVMDLDGESYIAMTKTPQQLYLIEGVPQQDDKTLDYRLTAYDLDTGIMAPIPLEHPYPQSLHFDAKSNQLIIAHDQYLTDRHVPVLTLLNPLTQEQIILPFLVEADGYPSQVVTGFDELYALYGNHLYRYRYDDGALTDIPLETLGIKNPSAIFLKE